MSRKFALIIGNTEYSDLGLAQLAAPGRDAKEFGRVLKDKNICAFDEVNILLNESESKIRGAIDEFFDPKKPDDLLILYFSGHGVRDELGALYLAVKSTNRFRLRSTAIKSDFIREAMDQSRSNRQVLILDCCNSGAFLQNTKAATGVSIGTATAFNSGYGHIILTASDSIQYAWEGDRIIGETDKSLFTHFLVKGLEGEADLDGDGNITADELYDYAYEKVKQATPKQSPSKFSSRQQGDIILRQNIRLENINPKTGKNRAPIITLNSFSTDKQLANEYKYIAQTAITANEDQTRVRSFYLIAVGALVAALFGTQLFDSDKFTQLVNILFSGLFILLTLLGTSTIMQLARIRSFWYESTLAMTQIKNFVIRQNPKFDQAFHWKASTLPPKYKTDSISYYQAVEIAFISGLMLAKSTFFIQKAFSTIGLIHWIISVVVGFLTIYTQLQLYKRSLV